MIRFVFTSLIALACAKGGEGYAALSESLGARITYSIFTGFGFLQYKNSTNCMTSTQQLVNDFYFFSKNASLSSPRNESAFANLDPYFNISNIASTSVRDIALNCPIAVTYWIKDVLDHFAKFENATISEVAESATFNMLAKSIILRRQYLDMQTYVN